VADEEATFEAIHAAAHPGRTTDADGADTNATTDTSDASDGETSDEEATR
jgi:hypothetical protein